jgi:hypothetical protein
MCEGSHNRALTGQPCKRSAEQQSPVIDLDETLCYNQRYVEDDFAGVDRPEAGWPRLVPDRLGGSKGQGISTVSRRN